MADQCPTCSCETNGDHTCPHTKAPTTRALADDLWLTRQDVARLDSLVGKCEDRLEALERAHTNGVGGCTGDQRDTPTDPAAWPADSALPPKPNLPNEPSYLDLGAALNQWQVRCNALESRLADTEARLAKAEATISIAGARHAYVLDTELKADRLERECREIGEKLAAMQADRDALKAKIERGENDLALAREQIGSLLGQINCWRASQAELKADRDALRAKLDGVREKMDVLGKLVDAAPGYERELLKLANHVAEHEKGFVIEAQDLIAQFRLVCKKITSALAAAENTNTTELSKGPVDAVEDPQRGKQPTQETVGDPRYHEDWCASVKPIHEDGPCNCSLSLSTHPSPAPAFEMTEEQRRELDVAFRGWPHDNCAIYTAVESLVRTALRDSREGWVNAGPDSTTCSHGVYHREGCPDCERSAVVTRPCAACGGRAEPRKIKHYWRVECQGCALETAECGSEDAAIQMWNYRPSTANRDD